MGVSSNRTGILIIAITFIWFGLVFGISFIEAPLKFTAPNITLPLGLGIGKIVFGALNKIEIAFSSAVLVYFFVGKFPKKVVYFYATLILIVAIQTVWLTPILSERADALIAGKEISKSSHHSIFIVLEIIKLVLLLISGIILLNRIKSRNIPTRN
ncbi:MAG: hypothetical protein AAF039_15460 [Bacteroidota bacterium]